MDFLPLSILGLSFNELSTLLALAVGGIILFMVLRFVLRVTRQILRLGCLTILLVIGGTVFFFWLT